MTQEEKAQAYDNALERMKSWVRGEHPECFTEAQKAAEFIFPELKESDDEKIIKEITAFFRKAAGGYLDTSIPCKTYSKWLTWLEKQGEQKPIDKTEPKFKVGDWVVNKGHSYLIADIDYLEHRYLFEIGGYEQLNWEYIENVDKKYHLWTIQDAKDGDVLYSLDSCQPFIYKERKQFEQAIGYCGINKYGKFFMWYTKDCIIVVDKYVPANKEQYDLLFQKMKEAGYKWNANTKEICLTDK